MMSILPILCWCLLPFIDNTLLTSRLPRRISGLATLSDPVLQALLVHLASQTAYGVAVANETRGWLGCLLLPVP